MRIKKGGLSWKDDPGAANAKMREMLDQWNVAKMAWMHIMGKNKKKQAITPAYLLCSLRRQSPDYQYVPGSLSWHPPHGVPLPLSESSYAPPAESAVFLHL